MPVQTSLVLDSLQGLLAVNPHLALDVENKVVYLKERSPDKVALICGGGSGHEPAHAGFVADGILTAAVCGNVFASPSASQVRRALELVDNDVGTIIIVKNYTGDILNFGLAKEQYAASHPEKASRIKLLVVDDDVSVGRSQGELVGRRGLAGTVLVYKIAGALARRRAPLEEVYRTAQFVTKNLGTIGVSLEHCHVPGTASSSDSRLSQDEIEIGMGIHNEAGHTKSSPVPPLSKLIPQMLDLITSTTDSERSFLPFKGKGEKDEDEVVVLVNNLGGISELEIGAIVSQADKSLVERGIKMLRIISGTFMTSLNMPGFSITLLLLPKQSLESEHVSQELMLSLLDEPTFCTGWKWASNSVPIMRVSESPAPSNAIKAPHELTVASPSTFVDSIKRACDALVAAEPEITEMDNIAGDGDCGLTLKDGATAVLDEISNGNLTGSDVIGAILLIARISEERMGGTSGALYSIFFSALAQGLHQHSQGIATEVTLKLWSSTLSSALEKLYTYTRARPPSRTLVDPLDAFIRALEKGDSSMAEAVKAASAAAEATRDLIPKAGRSAYILADRLTKERIADPGAWGVKTILENL